ncbi:MAG TPA: HD domain-containing protein [Candidatus Bipolaricaulis sp.]|nr:HD domain-containing protein [Candidatus Bipolaricaulis sp.]HPD06833.1 HD domain-containing protein [Candidatus Bipolaricaulis sp.]HRS13826.1 HD domain-containing protein [Candidatus Bipolaricaulis sp.]HRU21466.1 HD domain-containing protein [Candidatus Bipolaricaulis sp.]
MTNETKLAQVKEAIARSQRLRTLSACSNITAIDRLKINDHGPTHVRIVTRIALQILELLHGAGVRLGVTDHGLGYEEAQVVVLLGAALHDVGHAIHRADHELFSMILAPTLLDELLTGIYDEPVRTVLLAETMHAIWAHRAAVRPLTVEGGVLKVADALDMEKGRARIPFRVGEPTIHSVSALAIEKVEIKPGREKPVHIHVRMTNSAGIFQLDSLLKEKLMTSGLREYIEVSAEIEGEEKKIIDRYTLD